MKNLFFKITVFLLMGTASGFLFGMKVVSANKKPEISVTVKHAGNPLAFVDYSKFFKKNYPAVVYGAKFGTLAVPVIFGVYPQEPFTEKRSFSPWSVKATPKEIKNVLPEGKKEQLFLVPTVLPITFFESGQTEIVYEYFILKIHLQGGDGCSFDDILNEKKQKNLVPKNITSPWHNSSSFDMDAGAFEEKLCAADLILKKEDGGYKYNDGSSKKNISAGQDKNSSKDKQNSTEIVGTVSIPKYVEIMCDISDARPSTIYIWVTTDDPDAKFRRLDVGKINKDNKIEEIKDEIVLLDGDKYGKDANFQSKLEELVEKFRKQREEISNKLKLQKEEKEEQSKRQNDGSSKKDISAGHDKSSFNDKQNSTDIVGTISIGPGAEIVCGSSQDGLTSLYINIITSDNTSSLFRVGTINKDNKIEKNSNLEDDIFCFNGKQYKKDKNFQNTLDELSGDFINQREEIRKKLLVEQEKIEQPEEQKNGSFAWLKKHPILSFGIGAAAVATSFMYLLYSKSPQYGHGFVNYVSNIVARMPGYNFVTGIMG